MEEHKGGKMRSLEQIIDAEDLLEMAYDTLGITAINPYLFIRKTEQEVREKRAAKARFWKERS